MVLNTASGVVVGTVVTENWYGWANLTADGTRVVVVSGEAVASELVILDAATGTQVSASPLPGGVVGPAHLSADGKLAAVTVTSGGSAEVSVYDTTTGDQIGLTFTITGLTSAVAQINRDGTSVVLATTTDDSNFVNTTTASTLLIT